MVEVFLAVQLGYLTHVWFNFKVLQIALSVLRNAIATADEAIFRCSLKIYVRINIHIYIYILAKKQKHGHLTIRMPSLS